MLGEELMNFKIGDSIIDVIDLLDDTGAIYDVGTTVGKKERLMVYIRLPEKMIMFISNDLRIANIRIYECTYDESENC